VGFEPNFGDWKSASFVESHFYVTQEPGAFQSKLACQKGGFVYEIDLCLIALGQDRTSRKCPVAARGEHRLDALKLRMAREKGDDVPVVIDVLERDGVHEERRDMEWHGE
jgi:hypothetical protein